MARPFGVYVHFPYCAHRCPYCDFAVTTAPVPGDGRYARAVLAELALRAAPFEPLSLRSVYLGGGTPSRWAVEEVAEVLAAVRARFGGAAPAEVTIEANPESCDRARLAAWREAGVNRVSIGVQSFDPGVLAQLGRRHDPETAARAVRAAAEVVGNASVDLIYAARRSSVAIAAADAARAAACGAAHVSAYALTLDPEVMAEEVPLARAARTGRLTFPGDDEAVAQARAIRAALRRAGLRRYEVSNFSRPGFESVHNRLYWDGESYLGLGAGAAGCLRGAPGGDAETVRWSNLRDAAAWLAAAEAGRLPTADEDRFDARADRNERLMLGLRTLRGVELAALGPAARREVPALLARRLAVVRAGRLALTSRGLELQSAVAERLWE
ncbi:MAG TPA: radical SAM family heme chaperone HemW [Anaeromyxobacteraceae bacterium]|nr:radical SAM family heme chaperone HemW [Anaeromyxobacteraceae bacterium]